MADAYADVQALQTIISLGLPAEDLEQQARRTLFNIIARNQDDHVKNIGFVMDKEGQWRLSPAFDMACSYNPKCEWTSQHQMSLNGKCVDFELSDLIAFGKLTGFKERRMKSIVNEVVEAALQWQNFAQAAKVHDEPIARIQHTYRVKWNLNRAQ